MDILSFIISISLFILFTIIPITFLLIIIYCIYVSVILFPVCGTDIPCYTETLQTICENEEGYKCYFSNKLKIYATQYTAFKEINDVNSQMVDEMKVDPYFTISGLIPGRILITSGGSVMEGNIPKLNTYKTANPGSFSKALIQANKIQEYIETIIKNIPLIEDNIELTKKISVLKKNIETISYNNKLIINYLNL